MQGKEITFPKNKMTIPEIFREIERQTDYLISYPAQSVDQNREVTFTSHTLSIRQVFEQTLLSKEYTITIRGKHILIIPVKKETTRLQEEVIVENRPVIEKNEKLLPPPLVIEKNRKAIPEKLPLNVSNYRNHDPWEYTAYWPRLAIRSNLLYLGGTLTPNGGMEWGLSPNTSLLVTGSYNAWRKSAGKDNNKKLWHWTTNAEYRYWLCERFNGHFLGVHAFYGQYNISGKKIPFVLEKGSEKYRYQGFGTGAGLSYGYQFILGTNWNLELSAGLGMGVLNYDKWDCGQCGDLVKENVTRTFVGPTQLGISLIYIIK